MNDSSMTECRPPPISLLALFLKFLRFGFLAFGGPVAQIAMLRQALVEQARWIDSARFNRLLAILQILPGPEAHELCVHMGMIARGRPGGLLAGLGFMLPGLILMLVAGWIYTTLVAHHVATSSALLGVQIVVLAVIARAVARIGQHILEDRLLVGIAVVSLIATLVGTPFWIPLLAGGIAHTIAHRRRALVAVLLAAIAIAALSVTLPAQMLTQWTGAQVATVAPATVAALFIAGLKGGLLTFGGAYTAIPYVRADTVGRGWIGDATFLDGIAVAGILPAPLVIFATFVGYVVGGLAGGLAITAGMFLPAFAFSLIWFERLEAVVGNPALHKLLGGVAAAVVGIVGATLLQLGGATAGRISSLPIAILMFGMALAIVWRVKGLAVVPLLLAGGALAGWCFSP